MTDFYFVEPDSPEEDSILYIDVFDSERKNLFSRKFEYDDIYNVVFTKTPHSVTMSDDIGISFETHSGYLVKFKFHQNWRLQSVDETGEFELRHKNLIVRSTQISSTEELVPSDVPYDTTTLFERLALLRPPGSSLKRRR